MQHAAPLHNNNVAFYRRIDRSSQNLSRRLSDDTAALVWDAATTPFGELAALTASITQPLHLPGQYADADTGLHRNGWRDDDSSLGRYLQADPIGLNGGPNLYNYAHANPITYTDPDGQIPILPALAAGYAAFEFGLAALDAYGLYKDLGNECVSATDVAISGMGLAVGIVAPGGGYGTAGKAISKGLPKSPDDLIKRGYRETSHPDAARAGHRSFENPVPGDKVRFDKGRPGADGYEGIDHYYRENPNATGKRDQYLDAKGKPCARGCDASHIVPED